MKEKESNAINLKTVVNWPTFILCTVNRSRNTQLSQGLTARRKNEKKLAKCDNFAGPSTGGGIKMPKQMAFPLYERSA
jgi:hypothetical protein